MNELEKLSVGTERNTISYDQSLSASGLRPVQQQTGTASMASGVRPLQMANGAANLTSQVMVSSASGASVSALLIETANVRGRMNPVVQFDIDNSGVGNAQQIVRIGSVTALPGAYLRFNIPAGAADNAVIRDQVGVGCLFIQGYSELCSLKAVVVNEIHVISSNLLQLNTAFFHKLIHPDLIVDIRSNNIAFTQQKTDQKTTLNVAIGKWLIDSNQWLEFTALAGQQVSVLLHMIAIANVETFTPVQ